MPHAPRARRSTRTSVVRPTLAWAAALVVLAGFSGQSMADDGVDLLVTLGASPGEIRLDWTGGTPAFRVYRSAIAHRVADAANELVATSDRVWLDTPPAGDIYFYRVVGPCQTATPEACDGVDDDCNGLVDDGCGPCFTSGDCDSYDRPPICDSPATCQGSGREGFCDASRQCQQVVQDDDSACAGLQSHDCGFYPSVACTSAPSQPANQAALCASACVKDAECDAAGHCDGAQQVCIEDFPTGFACATNNECGTGSCVDGVCCNSGCLGTCAACDLSGALGTCTLIPGGQDPDSECGAVSCTGYYWGFFGDTCYLKANVPAAEATCGGTGACRTTAAECTAQTAQGSAATTCDSFCQEPTPGTCTGTTAGTCTNVSQGTTTCGVGPCQVTVQNCIAGVPNTCVPNSGAASPEVCDGIDNNCDGLVDNGAFSDALEVNNDCTSYRTLATVGSDQTLSLGTATVYPSGDVDYYRIPMLETDSTCACCDFFCTDEDYRLTVTLTVPAGAGSYQLCSNTSCAGVGTNCVTVSAGTSGSRVLGFDGTCAGGSDSYEVWVRVSPSGSPGYQCRPYTLTYNFDAQVCL